MKAYENLIHITPDMVVLESIGTTISPMTGLSYAVMQDGKHYDPDTETYIGEIDVDEYMGTISNDDEITFMAIQDQELNDYERYYKFSKGGMITEESNYDIVQNVKKEQGESDFYYEVYDKLVAYGERPKIAFAEMKEVFDNYDEDMSDYIDLPFAKGGEIEDSYVWVEKDNIMDVEDFEEDGEVEFGSYKDMMESLDEWNEQLDTNYTTIKEFNDGEEYRRIMTIKEFEEYKKDWLKDEGYAKGGMLDDKDFKSELKKGKTFYFDEDEEGYTARVGYQDFFRTMKYYIFFNGTIVHSSKTFDSMKRKLNQLIKKYGLEFKGEEEFAKGGEVKKKENNSMLIGGLAGILLGIFLGRR